MQSAIKRRTSPSKRSRDAGGQESRVEGIGSTLLLVYPDAGIQVAQGVPFASHIKFASGNQCYQSKNKRLLRKGF